MKSASFLPIVLIACATPAIAASPFDGTWKTDLSASKFSQKPDVYLLAGGNYSCKSCVPAVTIPADGAFHAVSGHYYYDAAAAKVDAPNKVTTMLQKGGKTVATSAMTVSADGKTLTYASNRVNPATGVGSDSASTATRVVAAPAGAHAISGSWRTASVDTVSDTGSSQTLMVKGETLTLSTPTGEGYTATFGGPPVVQGNDVAKTMITLKKVSDNHIVETDTRDGKVVQIYDMTVSPDGKTMTMVISDKRTGTTDTIMMMKQ